jgi:hypothetical protein
MRHAYRLRLLCMTLLAIVMLIGPSLVRAANPIFDLVLQVYSDTPLKIYDRPDFNATVVQNAPYGARMTWNGTIQQVNGRNWIQVNYVRVIGWASPDTGAVYFVDPGQVTPGINPAAVVQPMQRPVTIYTGPSMASGSAGQIPVGAQLTITDGPVIGDFYNWWQVKVNGPNTQGWLPDTGGDNLQTVTPLKVYGVDVCDNFKIKIYGAFGWDSIMKEMPQLIPSNEKIVCLASSNLRGDGTPYVTVLSRKQGSNETETQDFVRIFEKRGEFWGKLYEESGEPWSRTVDLGLYDLTGDGKPSLLWSVMADGTGHILTVRALRYHRIAGIQQILFADGLYKGAVEIAGTGGIVLLQADQQENEPNCCITGLERWAFAWQNNEFVQVINDKLRNPGALQGFTPQ